MALSFGEKRAATSVININVKLISGGGLTFSQKRESTKIINENVALLNGGAVALSTIKPIKTNVELDKNSVIAAFPGLARAGISQIFIDENGEVNVTSDYDFYKNGGDDQAIINAFNDGLIKEKQIDVAAKIVQLTDLVKAYREIGDNEAADRKQVELDALLGNDENTLAPEGKENQVKTAKGTKIKTGYTVVEATRLITSHDAEGNANPDYPSELQPRDRARDTSQTQIQAIAKDLDPGALGYSTRAYTGAPIIGKDRVVESGNGRAIAINLAYKLGKADEYRDWLINEAVDQFHISKSKIKAMKRPVLVRIRLTDVDRVQFAMESNQSDMLAMTATEKAKSDAVRLDEALMSRLSGDGDLTSPVNRDFVLAFLRSLGDAEAAQYSTTDGKPTKQLFDRIQAALFSKAYSDERLLELMADSEKSDIANIIKALNQAAPHFIRARAVSHKVTDAVTVKVGDAVDLSLDDKAINALIEATNVLKRAKDSNLSLEDLLAQGNVFGDDIDPVVAQMAIFIKENNRSANRMGLAFQTMAEFVANELERRENNALFVDDPEIDLADVLKAANDRLKKQFGDDVKTIGSGAKGGFVDLFTPTRGQEKDRQAFLSERDKNLQILKDVIAGKYDSQDSEPLLSIIESAMNGVDFEYDSISLISLVSKAMDKWLELDNKTYALDSVISELQGLGFSFDRG